MKRILIFLSIFWLIFVNQILAQPIYSTCNQGNIWFFGDSIGMDFNSNPPLPLYTPSPGPDFAVASLCDTFGRLQYYDKIWSLHNQMVMNKDSTWVQTLVYPMSNYQSITLFLPFTGTPITGYVSYFNNMGSPLHYGMSEVFYSRLLDTMNEGKGGWYGTMNMEVSTFDSMRWWGATSVRHANGRDWWVVSRRHGDDTMFVMLATPDTMTMVHRQRIGTDNCMYSTSVTAGANGGEMVFSRDGSRLLNVNGEGLVEVYDFDRCSGLLSNALQVEAPLVQNHVNRRGMYSACLSPSGRFIYTCQLDILRDTTELVQYDLNTVNPVQSRTILFKSKTNERSMSLVRLAPDDKIYIVQGCNPAFLCFPLDSSTLSVIEFPDSSGLQCNLIINGFGLLKEYIGGYLPANPNYDLGPIDGSPCDTLNIDTRPPDPDTTVKVVQDIWPEQLKVYPNPVQEHVIIESGGVLEVNAYHLYDLQGKLLQESVFKQPNSHVEINTLNIPPGHYVLEVLTSQGVYRRKLVKVE